ncbi:MAG: DNA mismatch repair endonuclease MutL [Clostridiales bacterium]|nr:DNA mismatch repair endonuclease MutL [Candidatus Equinaster intestinalis]
MPDIRVLPKEVAELIAAGEVVERPSAVIKELVENSIDAFSSRITVEIKRGGILYMSVLDNGCGIPRKEVPTAFLRHATSKIKTEADLEQIGTLGFRGEALASVCAVSKTELITRTKSEETGTHFVIEGGITEVNEEIGCDRGTLIIVRDIFYNTPARMKFLKSDVTEGNAIAAVVERMALSHPEIAFKLIRDGKTVLTTSGDGNLSNTVYSVLGREFASSLMPVDTVTEGIRVHGMVCKPVFCKQNRNGQFFFLNSRLIRSGTATAALEQAYKNSAMVGKFPCCVLFIEAPKNSVDVNVHPTKMEVRFSEEKKIFSAVYYAARNALNNSDTRPEIKVAPQAGKANSYFNPYAEAPKKAEQTKINTLLSVINPSLETKPPVKLTEEKKIRETNQPIAEKTEEVLSGGVLHSPKPELFKEEIIYSKDTKKDTEEATEIKEVSSREISEEIELRYIGEAFCTYIIVESQNEIYLIDKHAAHERIIYEQLRKRENIEVQQLLSPLSVSLTREEYSAIVSAKEELENLGFFLEDFGENCVIVRAVPAMLKNEDINLLVGELASKISSGRVSQVDKIDDIFHTTACKAAIKGNQHNTPAELEALAKKVLGSNEIMYCPHGRPVAFKIKRSELEKYFGRIV